MEDGCTLWMQMIEWFLSWNVKKKIISFTDDTFEYKQKLKTVECDTTILHSTSRWTNVNQLQCKTAKTYFIKPLISSCVIQVAAWLAKLSPPVAVRTLYHRQANYRAGQSNKPLCATTQVTNDPLIQGDVPIYCTRAVIAMYIAAHWRCRGTASFVIFKAIVNHEAQKGGLKGTERRLRKHHAMTRLRNLLYYIDFKHNS